MNDFTDLKVFQILFPQIGSDFTQIDTKNQIFCPKNAHHTRIFEFSNFQIFKSFSSNSLRLRAFARNYTSYYYFSFHKSLEFPKVDPRCAASVSSALPSLFLERKLSGSLFVLAGSFHE